MMFITDDSLNSAPFDSISFCEQIFEIIKLSIDVLWASSAHKFSLAKMASE